MKPTRAVADRLASLLARYAAAFEALVAARDARAPTVEVDTCFAALRLQQRLRWPEGAAGVDEVGRCAHDVLHAWDAAGVHSPRALAAMAHHFDAVQRLQAQVEALVMREAA